METLRDYVNWNMTHPQGKKSQNLFDKDNLVIQNSYLAENIQGTESGIAYYTSDDCTTASYVQYTLAIGDASDFKGKTITFSTPSYSGTVATKISVMRGKTAIQNGSNCAKTGDVYYSSITVDDMEYTTEKLCIMLYAYGKNANELIVYDEIMVNEGSEVLPYEPYR